MNAKLLMALLTTTLLTFSGTALAVGGDFAGLVAAQADASAKADYTGALDAADGAREQIEAEVRSTLDGAAKTATSHKANAQYKLDYSIDQGMTTSGGAKTGILAGMAANLDSFTTWAKSLSVKPRADVKHAANLDGVVGVVGEVAEQDGSIDVGAAQHLEGLGHVDYNLPPPPKPDMGFVSSIKIAFEALIELA